MKKLLIILLCCLCAGCVRSEENITPVEDEPQTIIDIENKPSDNDSEQINEEQKEYDYTQPVPENDYVDDSFFDAAAFIGDSRVEGMNNYETLAYSMREVYGAVSLNLNTVAYMENIPLENGEMGTLMEALEQKSFKKVYISFGINEIGWKSEEVFKKKYTELIDEVKIIQPEADIYLLGVYPFASYIEGEFGYTTLENLNWLNQMIADIACENQIYWIDAAKMIPEDMSYLPEEWTSDGYHLNSDGYRAWVEYLKVHTVDQGDEMNEE